MKEKLIALKSEACAGLTLNLCNGERQKLGELLSLIDSLILNKFDEVNKSTYNTLYKELMSKIVKNPKNADTRIMLDRVKNYEVSHDGYVIMKLLEIKVMLEGYNSPGLRNIIKLLSEINN